MKRLVKVEIETSTSDHCSKKCNWWGQGFAGRGAVCTLFEKMLQQKGEDFLRTEKCKQQAVAS